MTSVSCEQAQTQVAAATKGDGSGRALRYSDLSGVVPARLRRPMPGGQDGPQLERPVLGTAAFEGTGSRRERWRLPLALAMATVAHVALLLTASPVADDRVGARGADVDAISVEIAIIASGALESRATDRDKASGVSGRLEDRDGAAAAQETTEAEQARPPIAMAPLEPRHEPPPDDDAPAPTLATAPPAAAPAAAPVAPPAGGHTAIAIANLVPSATTGAAEASVGEIQAYSISVVEALARSRPRADAGMGKGTLRVAFEIASDGAPVNVRIRQSSGQDRVDRLVIDAVLAARFSPPPANASLAQRTYELPYVFR